ncbi:MAG: hypothetical protein JSS56_11765 [Proteobacteria bacterium]|nr:hypothetical protein [Pseudomonadota bacterium]
MAVAGCGRLNEQNALRKHQSGMLSAVAEICARYPDYVEAESAAAATGT